MQSIQCQKCPNILLKSCYMLQDSTCYKILQSLSKLDKRNTPVPRIPGAQSVQSQGPILLGVERGSVSPVPSCPRSLAPDRHDIRHVLTTSFASRWNRWNFPHATLGQVCFLAVTISPPRKLWWLKQLETFQRLHESNDFGGRLGTIKLELLFRTDRWVYCDCPAFTRWTCPSETCDANKRNLSCLNLYVCTYDIDVYASLYY